MPGEPATAHPMQPIIRHDDSGTIRFKANAIVRFLLDNGGIDLNALHQSLFTQEDRVQFAQLIGYSLEGFHELDYVPDSVCHAATELAHQSGFPNAGGCRDVGCEIHSGIEEQP